MQLQTILSISRAKHPINYGSKILLMGSCFAEHIGEKLEYYQFQNQVNPLGTFFHPEAIATFLERILQNRPYTGEDAFEHQGQWNSFEAHSRLSQNSREGLLNDLNHQLKLSRQTLETATHIFLTLGTAWGYRLATTGKWVANCHKVPQKDFSKELMPIPQVEDSLDRIRGFIRELNSDAQVVFSVSPVRHLKDGFIENQRSKAHLISAVHKITDGGDAFYFPAYEILMDELRDYRFYGGDMVHPNTLAVEYVWEKFCGAWIDKSASGVMKEVGEIRKGLAHRPFHPESQAHKDFRSTLEERIAQLRQQYPFMDFI